MLILQNVKRFTKHMHACMCNAKIERACVTYFMPAYFVQFPHCVQKRPRTKIILVETGCEQGTAESKPRLGHGHLLLVVKYHARYLVGAENTFLLKSTFLSRDTLHMQHRLAVDHVRAAKNESHTIYSNLLFGHDR